MKDSVGIRSTHILDRGLYDAKTDTVTPGMPAAIMAFDTAVYPPNRLGLTQWMLDEKHPLTARVFVNRIWQEFFGRGIVKTSGDFGMQGNLPTNLPLLDFLSIDFRENGWDIKRLVKQIVLSATYRQSAEVEPEKLEQDPENVYLARAPRLRLPAENVRDLVLASSGLLNGEVGGPSVKTYQPDGVWEAATSGRGLLMNYIQDHDDDLYRRGMYQFIKRTVPPPVMLMFDASNRDQCEVRRMRTNTPLQALVMLNDPHVLEASRVLAEKMMSEAGTIDAKIEKAFQRVICRKPKAEEFAVLQAHFKEESRYFAEHPGEAEKFLRAGEFPRATVENVTALAALMQVIHTIYNLEEAIVKT
jgi:hypothetical protein